MNVDATYSLTFPNRLAELARISANIEAILERHEIPFKTAYTVNLAIEEMVTNIIKYGFDDTNEHTISLQLNVGYETIEIQIEDDGHEFNPLASTAPDTEIPLEKRPVGGLGIHLVRQTVDEILYRRERGKNLLTVRVRLVP